MHRAAVFLGLVLAVSATAPAQQVSEAEVKDGFVSLFNGKDFSGWRFGDKLAPPANWKVEDGVIKLSGGGAPHLASQWDYEDFDVRLQWRGLRDGYNSGFFIRSGRAVGANQINLAQKAAGNLMGGAKGGKAVPELQKPAKEWNDWRVLAVGDKVTFWCNGQLAWEVAGFKDRRGHLGLQAEGQPMEFRNLRIKEVGYEGLNDPQKWTGDGDPWKRVGDVIIADGKGSRETARKDYGDYALRLEWKAEQGAAGSLALRGLKAPRVAVHFGDVEGGSGGIAGQGEKPGKKLDHPLGEWNFMEVRLAGPRASVWLNGTTVLEAQEVKGIPAAGGISLELTGKPMQLRNLRIKEIK